MYLEKLSDYDDLSGLLDNPNKIPILIESLAWDIEHKWAVRVEVSPQAKYLTLYADALLIDISIGNMIENACKFSKTEHGVHVKLDCDEDHFICDVTDSGPGIPEAEWQNVWQKFYRIGQRSNNPYTGCGLGLHVVKRAAEIHGGYSCVVSQRPSCIRFAIPKRSAEH
jgi:K+-sensing histidine kinase KdpD